MELYDIYGINQELFIDIFEKIKSYIHKQKYSTLLDILKSKPVKIDEYSFINIIKAISNL